MSFQAQKDDIENKIRAEDYDAALIALDSFIANVDTAIAGLPPSQRRKLDNKYDDSNVTIELKRYLAHLRFHLDELRINKDSSQKANCIDILSGTKLG